MGNRSPTTSGSEATEMLILWDQWYKNWLAEDSAFGRHMERISEVGKCSWEAVRDVEETNNTFAEYRQDFWSLD